MRPSVPLDVLACGCWAAGGRRSASYASSRLQPALPPPPIYADPWQLENACRQQCGHQRGLLSLGGAGFSWGPAVPLDQWVSAAADSLQALLDRWGRRAGVPRRLLCCGAQRTARAAPRQARAQAGFR